MSHLSDVNRERAERKILKSVTIRCSQCNGIMIRVVDLDENARIGYSCKDCPHYYLFN